MVWYGMVSYGAKERKKHQSKGVLHAHMRTHVKIKLSGPSGACLAPRLERQTVVVSFLFTQERQPRAELGTDDLLIE